MAARERIILLTGFEPFGGERTNPSWELARRFDGKALDDARVAAIRLPVAHRRAVTRITAAIRALRPAAVVGLGQAGGRPQISLERIAINLVDESRRDGSGAGERSERAVIRGGPDAYFSRLPLALILRALRRRRIPAAYSLSAGAFICNAAMYASLYELRRRPQVPSGFIHLPYEAAQASRRRGAASMSLDLMERAIHQALAVIAAELA